MGFGKIKKEVEASGLDPQVAHVDLTVDGHLVSPPAHTTVSAYYEPEKLKEILVTYPQDESGVPEIPYEQFVLVEKESSDLAEAKENEEDAAYVQKLLFDNLKQIEENEKVQESPKEVDSKAKEKKAPTKKKPTKK